MELKRVWSREITTARDQCFGERSGLVWFGKLVYYHSRRGIWDIKGKRKERNTKAKLRSWPYRAVEQLPVASVPYLPSTLHREPATVGHRQETMWMLMPVCCRVDGQ